MMVIYERLDRGDGMEWQISVCCMKDSCKMK